MLKPAWSPDGNRLALFAASDRTPGRHEIVNVDVRDGTIRRIADLGLALVDGVVWLPSGLELVVAGREARAAPQRLWLVSVTTGEMRPLTSDVSDYALAGVDPDGSRVLAVRLESTRSLWTADAAAPDRPTRVAEDAGSRHGFDEFAWAPDGELLYTVVEAGNADLWSLDPTTLKRRRLTTNPADDYQPTISPDGRIVVFASNRSGAPGLWSMSPDGTTPNASRPAATRVRRSHPSAIGSLSSGPGSKPRRGWCSGSRWKRARYSRSQRCRRCARTCRPMVGSSHTTG